jgi:hypothetical protein
MWHPLLSAATPALVELLHAYEQMLVTMREALLSGDWGTVQEIWARGAAWRTPLGGPP